jgi:hypothetical protein
MKIGIIALSRAAANANTPQQAKKTKKIAETTKYRFRVT